uniref:NADH-ubiquinone oxidoreductase chain 1 n=1 Tax=Placozoa sp. H19 TaxID=1265248 RepID=A0A7I6N2S1_9METZ|nr:NADH dehydrogenase subunit 1 [Placozoa sp. H19 HM-2017]
MTIYSYITVTIKLLIIFVPLLLSVAYLTLAERKVLGLMQNRKGPAIVGPWGLVQPIADGVKLLTKELVIPSQANKFLYYIAPIISFTLAILAWAIVTMDQGVFLSDLDVGVLYFLAISSLSVYAILLSGWASNSRYPFLGAIRCAAQMISYEVAIGLIIISVILCVGSLNISEIVISQRSVWLIIPLFPAAIMFMVASLAETARAPFDLTEGESELVSGFNVEYSSLSFALFFLAEYSNIILMSCMMTIFFLGGWLSPLDSVQGSEAFKIFEQVEKGSIIPFWFFTKSSIFILFFIWSRASFPRIRYDQLMKLLWKTYLPLSLGLVILTAGILIGFNGVPPPF